MQRRGRATTKIKQSRNDELDVKCGPEKHTLWWLKNGFESPLDTVAFDTLSLTSLCVVLFCFDK